MPRARTNLSSIYSWAEKTKEGPLVQDVFSFLSKERVLFIDGAIDSEVSANICAMLMLLSLQDTEDKISIWLAASPGGSADALLAIYDMMHKITPPIETVCIGSAASAAAIILAAGSKGLRCSTPNARIMLHETQVDLPPGTASEISVSANEIKHLNDLVLEIMARHTGQPLSKIRRDMKYDRWMSPLKAKEYGIIDNIIVPAKEIPPLVKEKVGKNRRSKSNTTE